MTDEDKGRIACSIRIRLDGIKSELYSLAEEAAQIEDCDAGDYLRDAFDTVCSADEKLREIA